MTNDTFTTSATIVGLFPDRLRAGRAVKALRSAGFRNRQIGILAPAVERLAATVTGTDHGRVDKRASGSIPPDDFRGVIPVEGPRVAAGTLGDLLPEWSTEGVSAGLCKALVGWGLSEGDARFYANAFKSGNVIVSVLSQCRDAKARSILHDMVWERS